MREQNKDNFLINIGEDVTKERIYVDTVEIADEKEKEIIVNKNDNDKVVLSVKYSNTNKVKLSLEKGYEKAKEIICKKHDNDINDFVDKGFRTFKSFMKDVVNLSYFDLELNENHMNLVYNLINTTLGNVYSEEMKICGDLCAKIDANAVEAVREQQRQNEQTMIDQMNAPTIVSGNWNNNQYFGYATKISGGVSKPSAYNPYIDIFKDMKNDDDTSDAIDEVYTVINKVANSFIDQYIKLLASKKEDLYSLKENPYSDINLWLNYVIKSSDKDYTNIIKGVEFYNIDIKSAIEKTVIDNLTANKEIDEKYLEFYKKINDGKSINISEKLVEPLAESITEKMDGLNKEQRTELADKEIKNLSEIKYLEKGDVDSVIKLISGNLENIDEEEMSNKKAYKKKRNKKIFIISLISIIVLTLVALFIIFTGVMVKIVITIVVIAVVIGIIAFFLQ